MNFFALSGLILGITIFPLGIFVLFKNWKSKINQTLALFCFAGALWGFGGYKIATIPYNQIDLAFFWWKLTHIGVILMPVFLWHFIYEFLEIKRPKVIISIYLVGIFFLFVNFFTDLFISNMRWVFNSFYWDSPPGLFYYPFVLFFFSSVIYVHYELYKAYKLSSGIKKTQIKYLFLAALVGFSGGGTCFLPCFKIDFYPILNFTSPLYPLIMTYAIVRYRLMDIRVAIGKTAVYLFSFATILALAFILFYLNTKLTVPLPIYFTGPFIIVISILLFQFFFKLYEKLASRYFYYIFYSYQKVLTDLGKNLVKVLDLKELSSLIVQTLIETMKLDKTVILLREEKTKNYQILKNIGFKEENGISLVKDNFLTQYLEKTQKPLIFEELSLIIRDNKDKNEREKFENLKIHMKNIEAAVCLPLLIERKIIGLIVLGNKLNGESYSKEDIELLISLANQSSIALYNAKLYSQVQDLSKNLEERVKEQVKQIEELSEMKSEFLKIVNHQLRTPTSIINGFLSMLVEGSIKDEDKIKETLKKTYITVQRLNTILDDLLNAQELVGEKPILNLKPTKIEEIIERLIIHFQFIAQQKNLNLSFEKPKIALPTFLLDQERIERALSKIIDNAILYTEEGGVTISVQVFKKGKNNFLEIKIKDTGIGLTPEDKNKIFKIFSRGEGIKLHPNGSGLGLYIAKEYIEAHQGKIEAESEGKNRGSTFIITLPAITEV